LRSEANNGSPRSNNIHSLPRRANALAVESIRPCLVRRLPGERIQYEIRPSSAAAAGCARIAVPLNTLDRAILLVAAVERLAVYTHARRILKILEARAFD